MNPENIESNINLVEHLLDAYGYCDEETADSIYAIIKLKIEEISKSGHPKSAYLQAIMPLFETHMSPKELDTRYNELMKNSAKQGVAEAQYQQACRLYEQGDFRKAVALYKESANQGYAPAQYCYGLDLYNGISLDVPQNKSEGLHYIELAAGQLDEWALEFLINLYSDDKSVEGQEKFGLYSKMLSWTK